MTNLKQFHYELPADLIAQQPTTPRDHCRLLVFDRTQGVWSHHFFYELPSILTTHHLQVSFVRNDSRVIPARLFARKPTGGKVEILLTRPLRSTADQQTWQCLTKPALKVNQQVFFLQNEFTATCSRIIDDYSREITFPYSLTDFTQFVQEYGHTPIPPYIHSSLSEDILRREYQTIYAHEAGSVAAPTAGLHFTAQLTQELIAAGHNFIDVTLHVGLGTFLGVKTDDLTQHHMHAESYHISPDQLRHLANAITHGRPLLAVGTTATRVLESIYSRILCDNNNNHLSPLETNNSRNYCGKNSSSPLPHCRHHHLRPDLDFTQPLSGDTSIFIYPPYQFQLTDHLITNFHLPESTLLMLVSAFAAFPNTSYHFQDWISSPLGQAYAAAIAQQYRFFSFGDAMLII